MKSVKNKSKYDPDDNHFRCLECTGHIMDDKLNDRQICLARVHVVTGEEYWDMISFWEDDLNL